MTTELTAVSDAMAIVRNARIECLGMGSWQYLNRVWRRLQDRQAKLEAEVKRVEITPLDQIAIWDRTYEILKSKRVECLGDNDAWQQLYRVMAYVESEQEYAFNAYFCE